MYKDYERFQFQPWPIKFYRYLRYRPKWVLLSIWWIVRWLVTGAVIPVETMDDGRVIQFHKNRWDFIKHLWLMGKSMTCCDTGHLHYMHEVMEGWRNSPEDATVQSSGD